MSNLLRYLRYDWPVHFILLLTNWLPDNVIFLKLRGFMLRPFLGACGTNFELGRNVTLHNPKNIFIGRDVFIAYGCMFLAVDHIHIDDEVMFGPYCVVTSGNHTRAGGSYRKGIDELKPIRIGFGAWIASHVVVTAGVSIGKGVLIAGGAVVTETVPENAVVGGVPARLLKVVEE